MNQTVTAVLLSWKRKPNMPLIIDALRAQTVPVEVWLINNDGAEDFGADRLISIPWNAGEWARYPVAGRVETEYCLFQDDDFMLNDDTYVEDAINLLEKKCPQHILGIAGMGIQPEPPHYGPYIGTGYANILKGHFQIFRSETARKARIPRHPSASDIYWALDIGKGERAHYVSARLRGRTKTLERYNVGYEFRPEHWDERNAVCADWLRENKDKVTE